MTGGKFRHRSPTIFTILHLPSCPSSLFSLSSCSLSLHELFFLLVFALAWFYRRSRIFFEKIHQFPMEIPTEFRQTKAPMEIPRKFENPTESVGDSVGNWQRVRRSTFSMLFPSKMNTMYSLLVASYLLILLIIIEWLVPCSILLWLDRILLMSYMWCTYLGMLPIHLTWMLLSTSTGMRRA